MIQELKDKAKELGFISIGFSKPNKPIFLDAFLEFLRDKRFAEMEWLSRNLHLRKDPSLLLDGCKTIISLAYPYPSTKWKTEDGFTVSRYSQPLEEDYHRRVKRLMKRLSGVIEDSFKGEMIRLCVDSAPILERSFGYTSGVGFFGKNNMLIIPEYGSFFYLGEIITTAQIEFDEVEPIQSMCGSCTRCVENCPTGALKSPFLMDAGKCLSYLTIEWKGKIDKNMGILMGDCFLGCDRCQEVCPFNKHASKDEVVLPSSDEILSMDEEKFNDLFGRSALKRAGLQKIKQNLTILREHLF